MLKGKKTLKETATDSLSKKLVASRTIHHALILLLLLGVLLMTGVIDTQSKSIMIQEGINFRGEFARILE